MPPTIGMIGIDPQGQTLVVSITPAAQVYTDRAGTTLASFPQTITARTQYWLATAQPFTVSTLFDGVEIAGPTGAPVVVQVAPGTGEWISPTIDRPAEETSHSHAYATLAATPPLGTSGTIVAPSGDVTGVTDTAAIQALLTAGKVAWLVAGSLASPAAYYITTLDFSASGAGLVSMGSPNECTITCVGSATNAIVVTCGKFPWLEGFRLKKGASTVTNGIVFNYTALATTLYRPLLRRLDIWDFTTGKGWNLSGAEMGIFENIEIQNCDIGVYSTTNPSGGGDAISNTFKNVRAQACITRGFDIDHLGGSTFDNVQAFGSTGGAAEAQFNMRGNTRGNNLRTVDVENPQNAGAGYGIDVSGSEHIIGVTAYNLDIAVRLISASGCIVMPGRYSTVNDSVLINATTLNCFVFENTGYPVLDQSASLTNTVWSYRGDPLGRANLLTTGEATIARDKVSSSSVASTSGTVRLAYFRATKTHTATAMRMNGGGTAAGATPSLARMGLFGVDEVASRTVTDGVTNTTTTITSATAAFASTDVNRTITGTDIPANTYIASVTNATTAVLSQAATGTHSGDSFTIGGAGNLTLLAATATDTALFATQSTAYTRSFDAGSGPGVASYIITQGKLYAGAVIVVTGATAPTFSGSNALIGTEAAQAPVLSSSLSGQSDLPATIAVGSLTASGQRPYMVFTP